MAAGARARRHKAGLFVRQRFKKHSLKNAPRYNEYKKARKQKCFRASWVAAAKGGVVLFGEGTRRSDQGFVFIRLREYAAGGVVGEGVKQGAKQAGKGQCCAELDCEITKRFGHGSLSFHSDPADAAVRIFRRHLIDFAPVTGGYLGHKK